jgi:hypothetical protein
VPLRGLCVDDPPELAEQPGHPDSGQKTFIILTWDPENVDDGVNGEEGEVQGEEESEEKVPGSMSQRPWSRH